MRNRLYNFLCSFKMEDRKGNVIVPESLRPLWAEVLSPKHMADMLSVDGIGWRELNLAYQLPDLSGEQAEPQTETVADMPRAFADKADGLLAKAKENGYGQVKDGHRIIIVRQLDSERIEVTVYYKRKTTDEALKKSVREVVQALLALGWHVNRDESKKMSDGIWKGLFATSPI